MKKIDMIKAIVITLIIGCLIIYIGISPKDKNEPLTSYMVYLNGSKIGAISNKADLLNKINAEQESIKTKYRVENVYPPNGLEIVKQLSYNDEFTNMEEIYDRINEFSIKGYIVTIKGEDNNKADRQLYILNKDDFNQSMQEFITIFVNEEKYKNFVNETQIPIADTGEFIENLYIKEKISIKEGYIGTDKTILTNKKDISRYLLYGTTEDSKKYTVKSGDTIESIAYNHQLSVDELLIANSDLNGADSLLSNRGDQVLNVSQISPIINVIVESELIEKKTASYQTVVKYDRLLPVGKNYVEQKGEDGVARVQFKVQYINGEVVEAVKIKATELSPAINKIIVRGGYQPISPDVNDPSGWARPTVNYCYISSSYGYRTLSYDGDGFHSAIDISGCGGKDSPIYAANDGVVTLAVSGGRKGGTANEIRIDHQNGFVTKYLHLNRVLVKVGDRVTKGQLIAGMGNTGNVSGGSGPNAGVHLHFEIYFNGQHQNPLKISPSFRY